MLTRRALTAAAGDVTFEGPDDVVRALASQGYLADRGLATALHLAATLERPLFLEGEARVGKTEMASAVAVPPDGILFRLQRHEGLDLHHAVYEWDYPRQLMHIRGGGGAATGGLSEYLLRRPLLQALAGRARPGAGAAGGRDRPQR